jgi:hypothetical protein
MGWKTGQERQKGYRQRMEAAGFRQVALWVPAEDVEFFQQLAAAYREERPQAPELVRRGRPASAAQLRLAQMWATRAGLPLPSYAATHHISLLGWIDRTRGIARAKERALAAHQEK